MDTGTSIAPVQTGIKIWVLQDWVGAWPVCTSPECGREIRNGDRYIVIPGSVRILCSGCMIHLAEWRASVEAAAAEEKAREREALKRRIALATRTNEERVRRARAPSRTYAARIKTCPTCKIDFPAASHGRRGYQTYCSRECMVRRNSRQPLTCPVCGRIFKPDRVQEVCTKACARAKQRGRTLAAPPPKPWSQKYPACRDCGSTSRLHVAQGYCQRCYMRHRRE